MTITWLKLDHNIITDVKLRRFSEKEKWAWIVLLCLASQNENDRGLVPNDTEDIADLCGYEPKDFAYLLDKFKIKGMIDFSTEGIEILNWEKRQHIKPSDLPEATRERKARQRARQREIQEELSRDVTPMSRDVTLQSHPCHDTDKDKDKYEDQEKEREKDQEKKKENSFSLCQENSKEPETEQATALNPDRPPNSATPPHAAPSKIASKPPQTLLATHPYPGLVEQGLDNLWTGANQTGANRLRSFDPDLVTGVIEHLTKYNLPNKRGDAIGCILNAIHQGQWGKLLGWYESGKAQNAPPIDTQSLLDKAIAAESAKRSWVQSKCAEGTTPDQALRLWDSLSTQERNSLLTEV